MFTTLFEGEVVVADHAGVHRSRQVAFETLVGIFTNFGTFFVNVLVDSFALAVCKDIHGVGSLALLNDNFAIFYLTYLNIWSYNSQWVWTELLEELSIA